MKKTLVFLTILSIALPLTFANAIEMPEDSYLSKQESIYVESSQEQINNKILNDQTELANEFQTHEIEINKLQKQIATEVNALRKQSRAIQASQQKTDRYVRSLVTNLNNQIIKLQKILDRMQKRLNGLENSIEQTRSSLKQIHNKLENKIDTNKNVTIARLQKINSSLFKNTRNWITAVSCTAIFSLVLFFLLRIQLKKEKSSLSNDIKITQETKKQETVKLDSKLITLMETQLKLIQDEKQTPNSKSKDFDHSLALKVADEIIRIQKNLKNMDQSTKGLKQLNAAVKRIQDNFEAKGYELVDMVGRPYNEGMKVSANFRPDESLKPGEQIITRIIKPQVNYNGVMIQAAQIEVSIAE